MNTQEQAKRQLKPSWFTEQLDSAYNYIHAHWPQWAIDEIEGGRNMSEQREFIRVRKVDNGYIVTCDAPGSHGHVAKNGEEVVEIVANFLGVSLAAYTPDEMKQLLLADRVCEAMAETKAEVAALMKEWESLAYGTKEAE